jgi:broad specificity phosphatase PhoE
MATASELGRRQAAALARALAGDRFAALYSSDLKRALDTAKPIAVAIGVPIQQDAGLRERHLGILQGRTRTSLRLTGVERERLGSSRPGRSLLGAVGYCEWERASVSEYTKTSCCSVCEMG